MAIDFAAFKSIHARFAANEYFLTTEQLKEWQATKPLQSVKVLHNMPVFANTLLKLEVLLGAGADIWVSSPRNIPADPQAVRFVQELGLPYIAVPQPLREEFDIVLECSADYANFVTPTVGVVELTGTGSRIYQTTQTDYPVISVDDSKLKNFETSLGTGDGCVRGLQKWLLEDLSAKQIIIFGFGKVGSGIANKLKTTAKKIVIVEMNASKMQAAQARGFTAYQITDPALKEVIQQSYAAITATGHENTITKYFKDKSWFANTHLINMGVHDEYGAAFAANEVLFDKQAINFSLNEPTLTRYIDPIFYAHNLAAELLLSGKFKAGYHAFPQELDNDIIERWQNFHGEILDVD
jgi:adenosylhomocysteinase